MEPRLLRLISLSLEKIWRFFQYLDFFCSMSFFNFSNIVLLAPRSTAAVGNRYKDSENRMMLMLQMYLFDYSVGSLLRNSSYAILKKRSMKNKILDSKF